VEIPNVGLVTFANRRRELVRRPNSLPSIKAGMARIRHWHEPCYVTGMNMLTATQKEPNMTNQTPLPLRSDTILGVCEAIGQDFGINPTWLRLAFIAPIFFAPVWTIAAYLGLGVLVAGTRLLFKDKPASEQLVEGRAVELVEEEQLPMAA
jgi:phage shock protein C